MSYPPNVVQQQPGMGYPYPAFQPQPGGNPNLPPGYPDPNQSGGYPQPGYPQPGFPNAPPATGFPGYLNPGQGNGYPPPGYPVPQGHPPPVYNPQPTVIGMQPMGNGGQGDAGWMPAPTANPNCPPGLQYLTLIDQLLVHQKVEMLEAFVGFETANKYEVKNSMGQKVFYAAEISDCCTRMCCGPLRSFEMKVVDNLGQEVIHFNRPLACTSCCFPCCLQTMDVCSPPGNVIGSIKQDWSVFAPKFSLKNAAGETILRIQGPFCTISCCGDVEFDVLSLDGTKVGKISKQWSGFVREAFTDADNFGISFPLDLDVKMKAVLLGACFLIDYMFFEKKGNKENDGLGMWS